ncbi:MAG: hypothetical protein AAF492_32020, partial [Verrucomicrobiota bacterium]
MRRLKFHTTVLLLAGCLSLSGVVRSRAVPCMVTSAVQTVRFGVETNWPGLVLLDNRHTDVMVYYCGGAGHIRWSADAPPASTNVWIEDGFGVVSSLARETMSGALLPDFAFIGVGDGETFWNLNQNFMAGELFLG